MKRSPNSGIATLFGVFYLVIGVLGTSAVMAVGLFDTEGGLLFQIFEVNIATNAMHVIIGLALIIGGASGTRAAKSLTVPFGVVFLALTIVGALVIGSEYNLLALNLPDVIMYFITALLLLATGIFADRPAQKVAA